MDRRNQFWSAAADPWRDRGNIRSKYNTNGLQASYTYATLPTNCNAAIPGGTAVLPGPHAASMAGTIYYCYDANGNMIKGGAANNTIVYSPYDLPLTITSGAGSSAVKTGFDYGPNREKIRRLTFVQATNTTAQEVTHYVGSAEVHYLYQGNTLSEVRRYLGPLLVVQSVTGSGAQRVYQVQREYFLTDAQGSTFAVLNDWGEPLNAHASMSFDPFGVRRDSTQGTIPPWTPDWLADLDQTTRHGYTGHEEVDTAGIIHMGGRLYDPALGRFLQADPFVQNPYNSQSLNRYSYVLNNPMTFTDPTGYFSVGDFFKYVAIAVIIYYAPELAGSLGGGVSGGIAAGAISGFAVGAIQTGNMNVAVAGAVEGGVFGGIGGALPNEGTGALYEGASCRLAAMRSGR